LKFSVRDPISKRQYVFFAFAGFFIILAIWFLLAYFKAVNPLLLPSPTHVCKSVYVLFASHDFLFDIFSSIWRIMSGFLLAVLVAVPVGLLIGTFRPAEAFIQPVIEFVRYMPVPAFLPLCILWFGIGDLEKIIVIFLGTFFQLVILVADDARSVPDEFLEIGYTFGLGPVETVWKIILPGAGARIFDNLRVSCGWAWSYLVVAELVAANKGIGFVIIQSQRYLQVPNIIGGIMVIGILGIISDWLFKAVKRILFPWEYQKK